MEEERENLEKIEPRLNSILDSNEKISDEFRDLAKACFGRIFYMLGEKNFKRWIDRKQINSQIKELVIESMDTTDMETYPAWGGFYTLGTNSIKLSTVLDTDSVKDTNVHETFHLLTDKQDRFCTFIDEGLTEYMKGMAINKPFSYKSNVDFVKFMHETLGDSVIKAYLTGKAQLFDEQLLNLVNYDNKTNISDIKAFYRNLDLYHTYELTQDEKSAFMRKGATPEVIDRADKRMENAKRQYDLAEPDVLLMYQKIIVGRISQMAKDMDFYKRGENGLELDLKCASSVINDVIKKSNATTFFKDKSMGNIAEWEKQTGILAAEQVLENSHVLMGYTRTGT